jgi:hypothetical protein
MTEEVGRWFLAVGVLLSWVNSATHVALPDRPLYMRSRRIFKGRIPHLKALILGLGTLAMLTLVGFFLTRRFPEATAFGIIALMIAIRRFEIRQWPGDIVVRLGKYVPAGAALTAWLVTQPIARVLGVSVERAHALGWHASCGVLAGAYVLAAIAKLRESGWVWMHPRYQALLVAERAYYGPPALRGFRAWIAGSKRASTVVGVVGLFGEIAAVGFLVPALRVPILAFVLLLNFGFWALLGYLELEWMVVFVGITLLSM